MSKYFPCWVCKGEGTWTEVVIEETGQGPLESCNFCEGEGMIEIGGRRHRDMVAESIGIKVVHFLKPEKPDGFTFQELITIGEAALNALPPPAGEAIKENLRTTNNNRLIYQAHTPPQEDREQKLPINCGKCGTQMHTHEIEILNQFYEIGGFCPNEKCPQFQFLLI